MCRPKSQGGRRCPSHSNPTLIAARNARRREHYHASKAALFDRQSQAEALGENIMNAVSRESLRETGKSFFNREFSGKKLSEMYKQKDLSKESKKINIKSSENEGYLVEKKYFAGKDIRGTINYNNLDKNSYKEFGFSPIDENFESHRSQTLGNDEFLDLSKQEIKALNNEEKLSLRFFTSGEFRWFNNALYSKTTRGDESRGVTEIFKDAEADSDSPDVMWSQQNKATVNYITEKMDAALAKGPGVQRIVYRGLPGSSGAFANSKVSEWIDSNAKLGQEVTFDGYQSTTHSYMIASNYSGSNGLVYEILTPEGVNVTSNSEFEWENEIILPRQSRYMVVGVHKDTPKKSGKTINVIQLVAINDKGEVLTGENETAKTSPFEVKESTENV